MFRVIRKRFVENGTQVDFNRVKNTASVTQLNLLDLQKHTKIHSIEQFLINFRCIDSKMRKDEIWYDIWEK